MNNFFKISLVFIFLCLSNVLYTQTETLAYPQEIGSSQWYSGMTIGALPGFVVGVEVFSTIRFRISSDISIDLAGRLGSVFQYGTIRNEAFTGGFYLGPTTSLIIGSKTTQIEIAGGFTLNSIQRSSEGSIIDSSPYFNFGFIINQKYRIGLSSYHGFYFSFYF